MADTMDSGTVIASTRAALASVIRGKPEVINLVIIGILSGGHVLLEDVPGVGKTTLAKTLSRALDLQFARVQFTPDLLPADILGSLVLQQEGEGAFHFQEGPIFTNVFLADEINRASPRTQSALLEAMNEMQVTAEGVSRPLPSPFFVIATQNPVDFRGTYPLPEAQLDRFLLRLEVGYPGAEEELEMMFARRTGDPLSDVASVTSREDLLELQRRVREVNVDRDVGRYMLRIVRITRDMKEFQLGISPRGALALFRAAQAHALVDGRDFVTPDDVQLMAPHVLPHRVLLSQKSAYAGTRAEDIVARIIAETEVPT